jgi:CubicO group peptidase (beta-lactamase class C family)
MVPMIAAAAVVVATAALPARAAPPGPGAGRAGAVSLHHGDGVATRPTDASRFKSCSEPGEGGAFGAASPSEVGLDAATLQQAADWYTQHLQMTMRVYRFGCLVQTTRVDPLVDKLLAHQYSTTKPTMTLVLGRAVQMGLMSVDDPLSKFFPGQGDAAHRAITIRQLLNHTSGVKMIWPNEINTARADSVKAFFDLPIVHTPGTFFEYSQIPCTVVTAAVQRAVGMEFQTFAQRELFDKVGIAPGTWIWKTDRAGWSEGFSELYLRPRDMARLGQLMLQDGVWRGERLIPSWFMHQMTTGTAENPAFGFNSWLNSASWYWTIAINSRRRVDHALIQSAPGDMYYTWGWRGRHIFVMPNLQMVVTTTPVAVMAPLPGQIFDGYNGHDPDYDQVDAHQVAQGEQRGGYHEFFRILMRSVRDQSIVDPGPWTDPPDNSFDPDLWVDAPLTVKAAEPTDPNMSGWWSWGPRTGAAYSKSFTTE